MKRGPLNLKDVSVVSLALALSPACGAPAPAASSANAPCVSPNSTIRANGAVVPRGPNLIRIEGGSFEMGTDNGLYSEATPAHQVTVATFYIDETEVSAGQYAGCVEAGVCQAQKSVLWDHRAGDRSDNAQLGMDNESCNLERLGHEEHPMNCVDWYQASRFCAWLGRRLPTEQEWEYAARGSEARTYPWGNEAPTPERTNISGEEAKRVFDQRKIYGWAYKKGWDDGVVTTAPVYSFPAGKTASGVYSLSGNVQEWTASHDCDYSGKPCTLQLYIIRGNGWPNYDAFPMWSRGGAIPMLRESELGFRCSTSMTTDR